MKKLFVLMAFVAVALIVADAEAFRVTTADAGGADCELRESSGTSNRGDNKELASRVDWGQKWVPDDPEDPEGPGSWQPDGWLRNSVTYLKFGVAGITAEDLAGDITVRMTYMNKNIKGNRILDTLGGSNTGLEYFVMDPTLTGANWDEMAITPETASAYNYDGDMRTKGTRGGFLGSPTAGLTYLGQQLFDETALVGTDGHMPVGGAFDFTLAAGSALHNAIVTAQGTDHQTVTVVWGVIHDYLVEENNPGWVGFNYVFNSKEVGELGGDPDSMWDGMSNLDTNYAFAPMLTNEPHIVPEPATMALLALGGILLRRKR